MMPTSGSAGKPLLVSRNAARGAFAKALNLYVGRGRRYSVKELSNATGVPDRVIECAKVECEDADSRNAPIEAVLSISRFLGAEFSAVWMKLADQGTFELPDGSSPPPGEMVADNAEDAGALARFAADGKFTPDEGPGLRVVGQHLMHRGLQLVGIAEHVEHPEQSVLAA